MPPLSPFKTRTNMANAARGSNEPLNYEGILYHALSSNMPLVKDGKYACIGSSRETILLNMASPALAVLFNECFSDQEFALTQPLDEEGGKESSEPVINFYLQEPNIAMRKMFSFVAQKSGVALSPSVVEEKVKKVVTDFGEKNSIPLETIVAHNLCACRHQALLLGYLVFQWLQKSNLDPDAEIFRFRTTLMQNNPNTTHHQPIPIAHAVTILKISNGEIYLLDATRKVKDESGLVVKLNHLDATRRVLLRDCYQNIAVGTFIEEILSRINAVRSTDQKSEQAASAQKSQK